LKNWHRASPQVPFLPYNNFSSNKAMTTITQEHWDTLYTKLYEAYEECSKNYDETYRQMIGQVLDHMIYNKPYLNIK
jgi:hypothetical protein